MPKVSKNYRTALTITGIVTFIATYHYIRIFNSWSEAFEVNISNGGDYIVQLTGVPFSDAYRYVHWLLTVPLLSVELILVIRGSVLDSVPSVNSPIRLHREDAWLCLGLRLPCTSKLATLWQMSLSKRSSAL